MMGTPISAAQTAVSEDNLLKDSLKKKDLTRSLYHALKKEYDPYQAAEDLFLQKEYRLDYELNFKPKPTYSKEAYKQRVDVLCKTEKCTKDLSRFAGKKTLCLGLEDVLMHISTMVEEDADVKVPIYINKSIFVTELSLHFRPYLFDFLEDMSSKYELILYSSLNKAYVDSILEVIEGSKKYFEYIFNEDACVFANLSYGVKCLDFLLHNRTLDDIVLVDVTVKTLPCYSNNFVPILPYNQKSIEDKGLAFLSVAIDGCIMKGESVQETISGCR